MGLRAFLLPWIEAEQWRAAIYLKTQRRRVVRVGSVTARVELGSVLNWFVMWFVLSKFWFWGINRNPA